MMGQLALRFVLNRDADKHESQCYGVHGFTTRCVIES
jgi:hypothetical protein